MKLLVCLMLFLGASGSDVNSHQNVLAISPAAIPAYLAKVPCGPGKYFGEKGCTLCRGCGSYQDELAATECKTAVVATCPNGTVPVWSVGAPALQNVCKAVPAGSIYDVDMCQVRPCAGGAEYQDETGKSRCKVVDCQSFGLLPKYVVNLTTADVSKACTSPNIPPGYIWSESGNMVRACFGCGEYSDGFNQTECKVATPETCGAGKTPFVEFAAESLASVCEPVLEGMAWDQKMCAVRSCNSLQVHKTIPCSLVPSKDCQNANYSDDEWEQLSTALEALNSLLGPEKPICKDLSVSIPSCNCPEAPPTPSSSSLQPSTPPTPKVSASNSIPTTSAASSFRAHLAVGLVLLVAFSA